MRFRGEILLLLIVVGTFCPQSALLARGGSGSGDGVVLYFGNASSKLLRIYRTNSAALTRLDTLLSTPPRAIDSILITGGASPVGARWYNRKLSLQRAHAVRSYLRWQYPHLRQYRLIPVVDSLSYMLRPTLSSDRQTDWGAQQRRAVVSIAWAAEVPDTLDTVLAFAASGASESALPRSAADTLVSDSQRLPCTGVSASIPAVSDSLAGASGGAVFAPDSAGGSAPNSVTGANAGVVSASDSAGASSARALGLSPLGPRFALKTNLLYWAALTPNIEAEWYFARRWSVNLEFQSAWWANRQSHKYFRLMAGGPEVRYWIAHREHFRGHFVGAYVGAGLYEFMGRPSRGLQGEFYITGGLSYGYAFRIGKRLRMEASVGVGYLKTEYREYHWDAGCYVYDRTKRQTYFGPTKVKLSLTYPLWWLGSKQKGGAR